MRKGRRSGDANGTGANAGRSEHKSGDWGEKMNDGIRVTENDVIGFKSAVWR